VSGLGLEQRIVAYLQHRLPEVTGIAVEHLSRIPGGGSQETYSLNVHWRKGDMDTSHRFVLRREPAAGMVVPDHDLEYKVYRALSGRGIPAPQAHFLELDPKWLDRPFFIMDMAPGKPGHFYVQGDPYDGFGDDIGRQFWRYLGMLAALDHREVGLQSLRNGNESRDYSARELDRWVGIIHEGEKVIEPIVHGAVRWLRRNPPKPSAKPAIVHGDYRSGNFLFTPDGKISAILDWEMCHIGDPLEDVAYAIDPFWTITRHLPLDTGLAIWEEASGMTIDREALDWWRLFTAVKLCAIWTTAEASFSSGRSAEMTIAMSGIRANHFHRGVILDLMKERGVIT
jgi:aminoglycoside phosphotransferase (APT) family kinase protein